MKNLTAREKDVISFIIASTLIAVLAVVIYSTRVVGELKPAPAAQTYPL